MSGQEQLPPQNQPEVEEDQDYLAEDDVDEVEEIEGEEVEMDSEGEEPEDGEEQGEGEQGDDAMNLLDNGLDDSFSNCNLHQAAVFTLQVHPIDSNLAVSGGEDDLAYIFRTDSGAQVKKLEGHSDSVTSCGWSFDGTMVATGGMDGKVIVWRVQGTEGEWTQRQWELLHTLEGPDEVNVSFPFFFFLTFSLPATVAERDGFLCIVARLAPERKSTSSRRSRWNCLALES